MTKNTRGDHVKPVNELEARRAVAGLDVEIIERLHVPPAYADAITLSLRKYLVGDVTGARAILKSTFSNGTPDRVLAEFSRLVDIDAAAA